MELSTIGVVGASAIGAGIAQLCVQHGFEVLLLDETEAALGKAEDAVLRGLHRAEQPAAFGLLRKATDFRRLSGCDLVLECGGDGIEAKRDQLRRIDARLEPSRVIGVQTRALPVERLASAVENPERVLGFHFFAPAPTAPLVELISAAQSSDAAVQVGLEFARRLEKTAVRCKDSPGFVVGRVSRPFFLSALGMLEGGVGTPAAIDAAVREAGGFRLGPFELMDALGLEDDLELSVIVYELLGKPSRLRPSALSEKLIARGCRGRRNSRGFYLYGESPPGTVNPLLEELVPGLGGKKVRPRELLDSLAKDIFGEAHAAADEGVADPEDIDKALRLGLFWPKGPFEWERGQE